MTGGTAIRQTGRAEEVERADIGSVRKRDGRIVAFDQSKIADAIFKAAQAVGGHDRMRAEELAKVVRLYVQSKHGADTTPDIEEIQDAVEKVLIENGHARTAKAYILYRDDRANLREMLKVIKPARGRSSSTDLALMVASAQTDRILPWDKSKIAAALVREADVPEGVARVIASSVEAKIFASGLRQVSTGLVRELVDNELLARGHTTKLARQQVLGMPTYDLDQLIFSKSNENSNITANNPEAINLAIAENTIKQYMLQRVFSSQAANAHLSGMIHIHDLGYPRVYCSSHSLEYIKKYGLSLSNLDTSSAPAKHARTLTGHLNTFLASLQAYYAGALGVGYVNIFYAPYLEGMDDEQLHQEAQYLIFSGSQNAFSRGGQTLFLDFNVHLGVPSYLRDVPAIGPGGKYTGLTYADYEGTAQRFAKAMLDVWGEGDSYGHVFAFPKCDLHVNQDSFDDPAQLELLEHACRIAGRNGSPYFVFDRDEVTLAACCRLRTQIRDNYMVKHPESMRFCGFQNVTVNLPQAAYRAGVRNTEGVLDEIDRAMDIAMQAHLDKKEFIGKLMSSPEMPLWQIGKTALDGRAYVDLEKATYIIGIIGLNECVQHLIGKELHDPEAYKLGLRIVSFMNLKVRKLSRQHGVHVALEESPAESATRRLAKIDLATYPEAKEVVKGDVEVDTYYYTNSVHFKPDAPISLVRRVQLQAKFHPLIESGAIIHAFVGEQQPPPGSIMSFVRKCWERTQAAQVTISPEFTICNVCHRSNRGLSASCPDCGSEDVYGITRIVGYFSRMTNWNSSKLGELDDRRRGDYAVFETT